MKKLFISLILLSVLLSLCACSASSVSASGAVNAPFSGNAEWEWSSETVKAEMGESLEPYVSIYNGTTYSYPLSWQGREGIIKFMFADDGRLASLAWTFLTDSEEELNAVIDIARQIETEKNGKADNITGSGSSGTVWYTDDKDILLSSVAVNGSYGFQYSYINRDFSKRDIAKSK